MSLAAERNNDRAGVCLFTDRVEKYLQPAKGRTHVLRLIRELLYFVPQHRKTNLQAPLNFLNSTLNRRSVVFLVTDAIGIGSYERELRIAAAHHDLIMVLIRDPREVELPDVGLLEVEDPETGEEMILDTSDRLAMKELAFRQQQSDEKFIKTCRRLGLDMIRLTAGESVVKPVCQLFSEREKRMTNMK